MRQEREQAEEIKREEPAEEREHQKRRGRNRDGDRGTERRTLRERHKHRKKQKGQRNKHLRDRKKQKKTWKTKRVKEMWMRKKGDREIEKEQNRENDERGRKGMEGVRKKEEDRKREEKQRQSEWKRDRDREKRGRKWKRKGWAEQEKDSTEEKGRAEEERVVFSGVLGVRWSVQWIMEKAVCSWRIWAAHECEAPAAGSRALLQTEEHHRGEGRVRQRRAVLLTHPLSSSCVPSSSSSSSSSSAAAAGVPRWSRSSREPGGPPLGLTLERGVELRPRGWWGSLSGTHDREAGRSTTLPKGGRAAHSHTLQLSHPLKLKENLNNTRRVLRPLSTQPTSYDG